MVENKIYCLFGVLLLVLIGCTSEPKPPPPPPKSALPMELLSGTWEVSDAVRNGKNTTALEGIYFTFTGDKQLISNFNLSVEERTFTYQMRGDTLLVPDDPKQSYLIESLDEKNMKLRTQMAGFLFKLTLVPKVSEAEEAM